MRTFGRPRHPREGAFRLFAVAFFGVALGAGCRGQSCRRVEDWTSSVRAPHRYRHDVPAATDRIGVVGDTQRTSLEGCFLGNEVNDDEQKTLLKDLAQQKPAAVVLLGDMVFQGDSDRHWTFFDHVMLGAGLDEVPIFPLLGNHDYMFDSERALAQIRARFEWPPDATYYAFSWGQVRMILLDANKSRLGADGWRREMKWLECEIDRAESGCARGVLLLSHQSPFTQSAVAPDDVDLQRDALPAFCRSSRKLAYISAHAHGYERWVDVPVAGCRESHTPFVISAGGGGPRPASRRQGAPSDASTVAEWPRPFNYLMLGQSERSVDVTAHMLRKGETSVAEARGEQLTLALAPDTAKPSSCACNP